MDRPLLIHIGYHKTGTTWLQKILFQPAFGYSQLLTHQEVFDAIVKPTGYGFDPSIARQRIERERNRKTATSVDVISSEILSGNPFFGGRESDQFAERLADIAPDSLILITIREQLSIIKSVYMQYISRAGTVNPELFFDENPEIGYYKFSAECFMYDKTVRKYIDIFGSSNVYVVTQEMLSRDQEKAIRKIAKFSSNSLPETVRPEASRPVAPSYPEFVSPLLRRINHFRSGPVHQGPIADLGQLSELLYRSAGWTARSAAMRRVFGGYRPVSSIIEQRFRGRFRESNRQLKALLGDMVDLTGYEGCD